MQKAMSFNDGAFGSINENKYANQYLYMSKDEASNLLENADLSKTSRTI